MKRLAWLGLTLALTACSGNNTGLGVGDAGTGGSGMGSGGSGGAGRGHPDGSIEVTGGTGGGTGGAMGGNAGGGTGGAMGGNGGGSGGNGGSMGGTGGAVTPDAGQPDAKPDAARMVDAADMCQACNAFIGQYATAIRNEQACNPSAPNQCLKQTPSQLVCGCPVWVTTTVLSDDVRMHFQAAGCQKCFQFTACPAIACVNPGMGVCTPVMAAQDPPGGGAAPIVAPPPMGQCMTKF